MSAASIIQKVGTLNTLPWHASMICWQMLLDFKISSVFWQNSWLYSLHPLFVNWKRAEREIRYSGLVIGRRNAIHAIVHPRVCLKLIETQTTRRRPSKVRRWITGVDLKNEGSMIQTCRNINVHVVYTDIYMLRTTCTAWESRPINMHSISLIFFFQNMTPEILR